MEQETLEKVIDQYLEFGEIAKEIGTGFCSNLLGKFVGKASDSLVDDIKETVIDYFRNKD